ncbi:hypothetical protein CKO28_25440 [Rhodovibrio sodomensis]|uniref:SxtJ n=2 Tax=Rhodovibrio sodomensis TaxID=1088 RepID=A0ABS1DLI6_9PROT|nr:hypothetical protein [Rhodovibrio sodomensis]
MPSERSFGLVFCGVFVIAGLWPVVFGGGPRVWALAVAAAFALLGFSAPRVLRPLNRAWFRFGLLLHKVVSPLALSAVFVLAVLPSGLLMRALGKDSLGLRRAARDGSYWVNRTTPHNRMTNQF